MRILMLVNWEVYRDEELGQKIVQSSELVQRGKPYWFFKYFSEQDQVDVLDIRSLPCIEQFEKKKLRFYVIQGLRAIPKLNQYDLIISHGMQSAVIICLWRRFFRGKAKHLLFEIGGFNSAAETGAVQKLLQFASKSLDAVIYHTSGQIKYYEKYYPWITSKARFIRFGTDAVFFSSGSCQTVHKDDMTYILCLGYAKRDWDTLVQAYQLAHLSCELWLVGKLNSEYADIRGVKQFPFVSIEKMKSMIVAAKFCVLPLKYYNYSYGQMTLLQQMALGKLVITSRVPSMMDYVQDNHNAVFYRPEDTENLKEKILWADTHEEERKRIGKNAELFVKNDCNERIMAGEIEAYIRTIVN